MCKYTLVLPLLYPMWQQINTKICFYCDCCRLRAVLAHLLGLLGLLPLLFFPCLCLLGLFTSFFLLRAAVIWRLHWSPGRPLWRLQVDPSISCPIRIFTGGIAENQSRVYWVKRVNGRIFWKFCLIKCGYLPWAAFSLPASLTIWGCIGVHPLFLCLLIQIHPTPSV